MPNLFCETNRETVTLLNSGKGTVPPENKLGCTEDLQLNVSHQKWAEPLLANPKHTRCQEPVLTGELNLLQHMQLCTQGKFQAAG